MGIPSRILAVGLGVVVLLLAVPAARADNVFVDCDADPETLSPPTYPTIGAALSVLPFTGFHTITVTGTCVEHVIIERRDNITLQAPENQTATISRPADLGNAGTMRLTRARGIQLQRLIIRDGGAQGLFLERSEVSLTNITVESNAGSGLSVTIGSDVSFNRTFISRGNGNNGVAVSNSTATFIGGPNQPGAITVENNGGAGFNLGPRAFLNMGRDDGNGPVRISGNQGPGIGAGNESMVLLNGDTIIENNTGNAANFNAGSRLNMSARLNQNILRNNGFGINANDNSSVTLSGNHLIQNNGQGGIQVSRGSNLIIGQLGLPEGGAVGVVIEGHLTLGVNIIIESSATIGGGHQIRNNGFGSPQPEIAGGIRIGRGSLTLTGTATVTNNNGRGILAHGTGQIFLFNSRVINNIGPGIAADLGVMVEIGPQTLASMPSPPPPVEITGNTAEGILLTALSAARLRQAPIMSGNGSTITCDRSSWLFGDTTGIAGIKCSNSDDGKKK